MKKRRDAIVELVNREGSVSFSQLRELFPTVSDMTLRTDLKSLDAERRLIRVHGGARSVEHAIGTDGLLGSRSRRNVDAKRLVATKALKLIRPDTTLFLDSGSTTMTLAGLLSDMRLIVFTNSISCVMELSRLEHTQVIVPGGRLNNYSMSLNGSSATQAIRRLSFDQLFLGVTAYSPETGFTCGSDEEAALKQACIEQAAQTIVLMDSSKVGHRSTFSICDLNDIDILICDDQVSDDLRQRCHAAGVQVL
ncbi:MAG: DeoR/GlpR transcriptional regulator [Atopobiaceae bacterium]|nr:DeoR/GlpR transcriptional regulator [Atopobiaceae bacterium]